MSLEIFNVQVYGLEESIVRSGYPMIAEEIIEMSTQLIDQDIQRARILGNSKSGSGHDCFCKGVIVQADICAPQYFWLQFERYHFQDTISSQSTMHRVTQMDISQSVNRWVDPRIVSIVQEKIAEYSSIKDRSSIEAKEAFQAVVSNLPEGIMLTRGLTLNYLQLKSMYNQRKNHKLIEWRIFTKWCESLPMFSELFLSAK